MIIPVWYNLRSLFVRRTTSIASAGGIALVALVLAGSLMLAAGVERTVAGHGRDDVAVVLRTGSDAELNSGVSAADAAIVRSAVGDAKVSAEIVVVAAVPKKTGEGFANLTLRGLGDEGRAMRSGFSLVEGRLPAPGSDEAIVGVRIRGRLAHLELGDSLELRPGRPVKLVGVFACAGDSAESEVWIDRDALAAAFGRAGSFSSLRVALPSADAVRTLSSTVQADRRLGVSVQSERAFLEKQSASLSLFLRVMGTLIAVLFSVGAIMGAVITMHGSVAGRTREIGALRALGFPRSAVFGGFLLEATALAVLGGFVGASASLLLGFVEISMTNYTTWSELSFGFTPTPSIFVTAVVFSGGMGIVSGLAPAIRASRITPIEALRS